MLLAWFKILSCSGLNILSKFSFQAKLGSETYPVGTESKGGERETERNVLSYLDKEPG